MTRAESHKQAQDAFSAGYKAAAERGYEAKNPFCSSTHFHEWDAWESGKSIGVITFESAKTNKAKA